ncbi:asparagine synthase (glutamine-hydrolyzing) [Lichenifustis flavocetrariae]|uniref:asparagine synthase (glutamine-hydrolyzing) n=1 Tax=Lichenifustis flavocetrariae TaxID=2949735 RepID=A0AA41Z006_9HYPH|nr:asparagine synthase (glutamine-hydrolyzing) [Lichenifustis flavocetrariae]MCW6510372.1 asparagine synthase (glutamine-hydrolyzing) [Lichenifustis flavocetrariae]
MCGIAGLSMKADRPVDRDALAILGGALSHRGPDGSGEYLSGGVGFRHERLAIIDLDTGDQPLFDDGDRALVANGEIYNYLELKAAMPGTNWRTRSDCEPLLALYARHGLDFLNDVRGMFALALHDPASDRVVLARDPFGIKPLYYAEEPDCLLFASEPQAIVAARKAATPAAPEPTIRSQAVYQSLQLQFTTGSETIFEGIRRVLPGEILVVEQGTIVERRMGPAVLPAQVRRVSEREACDAIDKVIDDTVSMHQRSDVPYGLFLSSGIDSSAILTAMARLNTAPVRTYTAAFPETGVHDERETARAMAVAAGARHTEVPITADLFWQRLPEICAALDDPVSDYAIVPMFLLAERAAEDVKVVLSGIGGDELFAGYRRYRRQMLPRWLGGRSRRPNGPCDGLDLFRERLTGWRDGIAAAEAAMAVMPYNALQRAQAVDFVDWLPHSVLVALDRCLMHFGLEGRTPLLDRAVADFAFPLPNTLKLRHGQGKYLLRRWLADANNGARPFAKKLGFTVPVAEWISTRAGVLGPLVAQAPGVAELCRPQTVLDVFASRDKAHGLLAWRLLFFALWHRRHVRGLMPEADTLACLQS